MTMNDDAFFHIPVLRNEVIEYLKFDPERPARFVDGTVGGGGHSAALLERYPRLEMLGIDRDLNALDAAKKNLAFAGKRVTLVRGNYGDIDALTVEHGWDSVNGILLDIGVSSPQIDHASRGFSWRQDGPLDMRMDQRAELTAGRWLNRASESELEAAFRNYGEIIQSRKLARAVVERRIDKPFGKTSDLVEVTDAVLGKSRPGKLPHPTLVFQALRIEVNGELQQLSNALTAAQRVLRAGGRLAVISFHSLEDRIVKNFMRDAARECICPPGLPVCVCNNHAVFELPVRGVVTAGNDELTANRRAACAKLRVADRTEFNNQ